MNRRTRVVLLVGGLAVAMVVGLYVAGSVALTRAIDPGHQCETGFSPLSACTYHWTSRTQSGPMFAPVVDMTSWAVAQCPENELAKRVLCAVGSTAAPASAASDDAVTGLPRPRPWLVTTAKKSPLITSFHLETPLDLAAVLGFYRAELRKRGWTENDGAVVAPDRAVLAFTTADGPAQLRLIRENDTTIADLSLRKPVAANATVLPAPGQARLMLGNETDEAGVITINQRIITLAARTDAGLTDATNVERELPERQKIDLPPGKYKVTMKVAGSAAQDREFEVAAGETWALVIGPAGVPIPVRLD